MIEYLFEYTSLSGQRPQWVKTISNPEGGDPIRTVLNFHNTQERGALSTEQVYQHIDNLIQYIKDVSQGISSVSVEGPIPPDGWHIAGGWGEVEWAKDEIFNWWESVYYQEPEA